MDINLDDSDDEKKAPSRRAPSRVIRHAPRSSKPKTEQPPPQPKSETAAAAKSESPRQRDDHMEVEEQNPSVIVTPKTEEAAAAGSDGLKMESEVKRMEIEKEMVVAEPMEEDREEEKPEEVEEEEEEDMIVREIDVYFNPSLDPKTQLYLLQYPLRACWRPYELDERCEEVRVKTSTSEVEVDLSLDLQSNCDTDVANKLEMTKQTLANTWNPPQASSYAVGILRGNELHLNPIHAVVQLRPSMDHIKAGGSKRKSNTTDNVEVKLEDANGGKSAASSKKQPKRKESTDQETEDDEGWVSLKYHGPSSEFSENCIQRMAAKEESPLQFTMDPNDYINLLCPGTSASNDNKSKRKSLLSLPLEERIKKLLSAEPLFHRFSALKHFAPDNSIEDVLGVVQQHALLVQGLWTPKICPLLTEDIRVRPFLRDYILFQFTQNTVFSLENSDLPQSFKTDATRLLKIVAVERSLLKNWKFKVDTDTSFIKQYPDIIMKQNDIWKRIIVKVKTQLTQPTKKNKPHGNTSASAMESDKGAKQSGVAASGGPRTSKKMSDEVREALPKALKKVFQTYKVCSFQLITQALKDLSVSQSILPKADNKIYAAAVHGIDASPQEFQEVINQIAYNIHGVYALKSSAENLQYDPLRKVVIDLLRGKPANSKLKKTEVVAAAKIELDREISTNEYNKVMNDICEFKDSAWVLRSGDGSTKGGFITERAQLRNMISDRTEPNSDVSP